MEPRLAYSQITKPLIEWTTYQMVEQSPKNVQGWTNATQLTFDSLNSVTKVKPFISLFHQRKEGVFNAKNETCLNYQVEILPIQKEIASLRSDIAKSCEISTQLDYDFSPRFIELTARITETMTKQKLQYL